MNTYLALFWLPLLGGWTTVKGKDKVPAAKDLDVGRETSYKHPINKYTSVAAAVVWSLSCVRLFVTPWTAARQASLSFTISQSLLKLMSIELVMPSNHLILCHLLLLRLLSFPVSQLFASGGQSIGASASVSVAPKNTQGWFPLGLTGLVFLLSKGLSRVFSNTTVQKHQFFSVQPSFYGPTLTSIHHYWKNHSLD